MSRSSGLSFVVLLSVAGLVPAAPACAAAGSAGASPAAVDSLEHSFPRGSGPGDDRGATPRPRRDRRRRGAGAGARPEIWRELREGLSRHGPARVAPATCLRRAASLAANEPGHAPRTGLRLEVGVARLQLGIPRSRCADGARSSRPPGWYRVDPEPRVALMALALVKGDVDLAMRAAQSALLCDPSTSVRRAACRWVCAGYPGRGCSRPRTALSARPSRACHPSSREAVLLRLLHRRP